MPHTHGTIIAVDDRQRTLTLQTRREQQTLYFQRALFTRFFKYFEVGNHVQLSYKIKQPTPTFRFRYHTREVKQILRSSRRGRVMLYSQRNVKTEIKDFVSNLKVKMFLDLEMSMHPYKPDANFKQEIIQVGYVLVDENDHVIDVYNAVVQPTIERKLTLRTLKFLNITQSDIEKGIEYSTFYTHFKKIIKKYRPAIIVWGKNDHLALKESYEINQVSSLDKECRFVNLLMLHKNYFHLKDDLGLVNAYHLYGHSLANQRHDAFEDAMMTYRIYEGFKSVINHTTTVDLSPIKK